MATMDVNEHTSAAGRGGWLGSWPALAGLALLALLVVPAGATPLPADPAELRCWLQHTRERTRVNRLEPTAVEFSNLRNSYRVRSPLLVEFAVRGMGVAPAGVELEGTGHHHILIDKALPQNITEPLPFDDKHRHFGKGQTQTLIDLQAGPHTLRLLFANHAHQPYFVYSREIRIEVLGPRAGVPAPRIDPANFDDSCEAWYQDQRSSPRPTNEPLYASNIRAREPVTSPFSVRLGNLTHGICAGEKCPEKTGRFQLDVFDAAGRRVVQSHSLSRGATQQLLDLDNGSYVLRLRLVDQRGTAMLPLQDLPVRVVAQEPM
jgi:hypothetical protein